MKELERDRPPDVLLREWLLETDTERAGRQLEQLLARHAKPLVHRIVGFKLAAGSKAGGRAQADAEDVCHNALCQLLARLNQLKSGGDAETPRDFTAYAAVTAYNACNEYFRSRRPAWLSFSMKVRYAATHSPEFALWETEGGKEVCGLAPDRGREAVIDTNTLSQACEALRRRVDASRLTVVQLMREVLSATGGPLILDSLVELAAELSGVREERVLSLDNDPSGRPGGARGWEQLRDSAPAADVQLIRRDYILHLWNEICDLPLEHRKALLLNLNDSTGGDIRLFDSLGIASVREIAAALGMDALEFAELWKDLPLDDARVAQRLGVSRQDVINRRSSARKRLARRMREGGGED